MANVHIENKRKPLPSPLYLKTTYSLNHSLESFVNQSRNTVVDILNRKDPRLLIIVGPCSIHDVEAALQYASQLKELSLEMNDTFFTIMRVYLEKPRTRLGWKGFLNDPQLDGSHDIESGLHLSRKLLIDLARMEMPVATEFLDPLASEYYGDLITWGCVGARTVNSQIHRQMASGLSLPIGFKNTVEGNVDIALNAIHVASVPHSFLSMDEEGRITSILTPGNPECHLVLRGSLQGPNYDPGSVEKALHAMQELDLVPRLVIDCSHDNSYKQHEKQIPAFETILHQVVEGNPWIRGLMLESYLHSGQQILSSRHDLQYGVSITDPCLDWENTMKLLRIGRNFLKHA